MAAGVVGVLTAASVGGAASPSATTDEMLARRVGRGGFGSRSAALGTACGGVHSACTHTRTHTQNNELALTTRRTTR